jgi:hypothetical protein
LRKILIASLLLSACSTLNAGAQTPQAAASPALSPTPIASAMAAANASADPRGFQNPLATASPKATWIAAGHHVSVDVADDDASRKQGLSGRPSLAPDTGLALFWYAPVDVRIWMPDMNFPIDVIFVSQGKVVMIYPDAQPCPSRGDCPDFGPDQAVDYVIEVPAGSAAQWGLKTGDAVQLVR